MTPTKPLGPLVSYPETYACPRCSGALDRAATVLACRRGPGGPIHWTVRAWCDFCEALFIGDYVQDDFGRLLPNTPVSLCENQAEIDQFLRRLRKLRGDRVTRPRRRAG